MNLCFISKFTEVASIYNTFPTFWWLSKSKLSSDNNHAKIGIWLQTFFRPFFWVWKWRSNKFLSFYVKQVHFYGFRNLFSMSISRLRSGFVFHFESFRVANRNRFSSMLSYVFHCSYAVFLFVGSFGCSYAVTFKLSCMIKFLSMLTFSLNDFKKRRMILGENSIRRKEVWEAEILNYGFVEIRRIPNKSLKWDTAIADRIQDIASPQLPQFSVSFLQPVVLNCLHESYW